MYVEIDFKLTESVLSCLSLFLASCIRKQLFSFVQGNDAIALLL